jgi:hypothetical protein
MSTPNTTRWIGIGLLGLPLYGALTFLSSIDPQPDSNTHLEAWARYVTTDHYVLGHLLYSILGLIFAIFALGAYLTRSSVGGMGLVAMVITVLGNALFLPLQGVSTSLRPRRVRRSWLASRSLRSCPPYERPAPTLLRPGGGDSGPAEGAMTPPGGLRRTVSWRSSQNTPSMYFVNKGRKRNRNLTHWAFARGLGLLAHH